MNSRSISRNIKPEITSAETFMEVKILKTYPRSAGSWHTLLTPALRRKKQQISEFEAIHQPRDLQSESQDS